MKQVCYNGTIQRLAAPGGGLCPGCRSEAAQTPTMWGPPGSIFLRKVSLASLFTGAQAHSSNPDAPHNHVSLISAPVPGRSQPNSGSDSTGSRSLESRAITPLSTFHIQLLCRSRIRWVPRSLTFWYARPVASLLTLCQTGEPLVVGTMQPKWCLRPRDAFPPPRGST